MILDFPLAFHSTHHFTSMWFVKIFAIAYIYLVVYLNHFNLKYIVASIQFVVTLTNMLHFSTHYIAIPVFIFNYLIYFIVHVCVCVCRYVLLLQYIFLYAKLQSNDLVIGSQHCYLPCLFSLK